ncbi:hypothetical protein [Pedobacter sp. L105]|uniref:hypothetical protein n=1 Tax=Pedobacter sp. L105 TaxID=1641871 RepID=UPI00131B8DC1|nr:hypothetical protein [Pedobacter sp. L105]
MKKEKPKSDYILVKRALHQNGVQLVFVFLAKTLDEAYNPNNPEQRKYTVGWEYRPESIKLLLIRHGVDQLSEDMKLAYRIVYEDALYGIKQLVSNSEYTSMLKYMDDYIDINVYSCINIDAFLHKML